MRMNRITFNGRVFRRPTRHSERHWKQPRREWHKLDPYDGPEHYWRCTRPGALTLSIHHSDEEGYSGVEYLVDFDLGRVTVTRGGRDCDGVLEHSDEYVYRAGQWRRVGSRVYDQYAQLAGY